MITELRSLWKEAFGDSEAFMDDFFQVAYDQSRCRFIRKNGKTVSALYWFDVDVGIEKMAYLYGVATLTEYRGQGFAAYLIEKTCKELKEKGLFDVAEIEEKDSRRKVNNRPGKDKTVDFSGLDAMLDEM